MDPHLLATPGDRLRNESNKRLLPDILMTCMLPLMLHEQQSLLWGLKRGMYDLVEFIYITFSVLF